MFSPKANHSSNNWLVTIKLNINGQTIAKNERDAILDNLIKEI